MSKYNTGDVLRVKPYDELSKVRLSPGFVPNMKYMCGKIFTVSKTITRINYIDYYSEEKIEYSLRAPSERFHIAEWMLEPVRHHELTLANDDDFTSLFSE